MIDTCSAFRNWIDKHNKKRLKHFDLIFIVIVLLCHLNVEIQKQFLDTRLSYRSCWSCCCCRNSCPTTTAQQISCYSLSLSTNWILNMEFVSKHATDGNWLFILLENIIAFLLLLFIGHFCISNKTKQKLKSFLFCWWIQIQEKRFSGGKTWFVWQSTNRRTN